MSALRAIMAVAIAILVAGFAARAFAAAAAGELKVEGSFVVATPADGFAWSKLNEAAGPPKVAVYVAKKGEGEEGTVVLTVQGRVLDQDPARVATLKANYNAMVQTLQAQKFTELKGSKPALTPPIPDRVAFIMMGKNAQGGDAAFYVETIFGKRNTYLLQAAAGSADAAKALGKVAGTLKEEPADAAKTDRK
jgi:hypothetical protein